MPTVVTEHHRGRGAGCVAAHVGERFLGPAVEREARIGWERSRSPLDRQGHSRPLSCANSATSPPARRRRERLAAEGADRLPSVRGRRVRARRRARSRHGPVRSRRPVPQAFARPAAGAPHPRGRERGRRAIRLRSACARPERRFSCCSRASCSWASRSSVLSWLVRACRMKNATRPSSAHTSTPAATAAAEAPASAEARPRPTVVALRGSRRAAEGVARSPSRRRRRPRGPWPRAAAGRRAPLPRRHRGDHRRLRGDGLGDETPPNGNCEGYREDDESEDDGEPAAVCCRCGMSVERPDRHRGDDEDPERAEGVALAKQPPLGTRTSLCFALASLSRYTRRR